MGGKSDFVFLLKQDFVSEIRLCFLDDDVHYWEQQLVNMFKNKTKTPNPEYLFSNHIREYSVWTADQTESVLNKGITRL